MASEFFSLMDKYGNTLPASLIAWWKLHTDGLDYTANGHDLIMNGSVPFTTIDGQACAGPYTGSDFFSVPASMLSAMTASTTALCFEFSYRTASNGDYWMFASDSGGDEWGAFNGDSSIVLWWRHNGPGIWEIALPVQGSWHNMAFNGFGTTLETYKEGILQSGSELIVPGDWKFNSATLMNIGKHNTGANPFNGYLHDIKVWSVDMTGLLPSNP